MFMGQTMKTIGKFSAATFLRNFLFLAILLWHSGSQAHQVHCGTVGVYCVVFG